VFSPHFEIDEETVKLTQKADKKGWVLMQYTGLKDKNGKEIYEGDIVADRDTSDCVFGVKWDVAKAGYYMPPEFDEEYAYSIGAVSLEVIGNIYENPELWK
jgi:uncharacterized phage protein (TIGR01671 family)